MKLAPVLSCMRILLCRASDRGPLLLESRRQPIARVVAQSADAADRFEARSARVKPRNVTGYPNRQLNSPDNALCTPAAIACATA